MSRWGRRAFYPLALVPLCSLLWVGANWPTAHTPTVRLTWVPDLSMDVDLPFGGYKHSGVGKEWGPEGFDEYPHR